MSMSIKQVLINAVILAGCCVPIWLVSLVLGFQVVKMTVVGPAQRARDTRATFFGVTGAIIMVYGLTLWLILEGKL